MLQGLNKICNNDLNYNSKNTLFLQSTNEISSTLKNISKNNKSIIICGGQTGLVSATEVLEGEIVIDLKRFNKIEEIDHINKTITVQSGVVLEEINNQLAKYDLELPVSFGAKGSAQIGGCIATNAGGAQVLKYGMMRDYVLGLEVVLADGTVINGLRKIIKDNSGYNLNHFFIGSEGTLGIITRAVLRAVPRKRFKRTILLACNEINKCLREAQIMLNEHLLAFEVMWPNTFNNLLSNEVSPIKISEECKILIEIEGNDSEGLSKKVESLFEIFIKKDIVSDAVLASSEQQRQQFWNIRDNVQALMSKFEHVQNFDISIPTSEMQKYVQYIIPKLNKINGVIEVFPFGHLADGNLHMVVGKKNGTSKLKYIINEIVYTPLKELRGSISAEHGIGIDKKEWLSYCRSKEEIQLMKIIKRAIDPNNILNRGRIFDLK